MHPSERLRNLTRTLNVRLAGIDLGDAELYPDGDERAPDLGKRAWVRATLQSMPGRYAGKVRGRPASREERLLTVECWVRGSASEDEVEVDEVDGVAEQVAAAFRFVSLPLRDFVDDESGPEVDGHSLRFLKPPSIVRVEPESGFQRRNVLAPFTFFIKTE